MYASWALKQKQKVNTRPETANKKGRAGNRAATAEEKNRKEKMFSIDGMLMTGNQRDEEEANMFPKARGLVSRKNNEKS